MVKFAHWTNVAVPVPANCHFSWTMSPVYSGHTNGNDCTGELPDVLAVVAGFLSPASALHRLERAGLIRSDWETVSGRRRRAYQLTASGRQALHDQRAVWTQFSTAVTALLTSRPWPATT